METNNLCIQALAPRHVDAIQQMASDPSIAATTRIPHPYPENSAREFVVRHLWERAEGLSHVFVIECHEEPVGLCGLHGIEGKIARELGYWIGRPYWGRGYASFGVKAVLDFAFEELNLALVGSCALESNTASRRVLEKNGFRLLRLEHHNDPLLKRPHERLAIYEKQRGTVR